VVGPSLRKRIPRKVGDLSQVASDLAVLDVEDALPHLPTGQVAKWPAPEVGLQRIQR
jgi:hypothetical protein